MTFIFLWTVETTHSSSLTLDNTQQRYNRNKNVRTLLHYVDQDRDPVLRHRPEGRARGQCPLERGHVVVDHGGGGGDRGGGIHDGGGGDCGRRQCCRRRRQGHGPRDGVDGGDRSEGLRLNERRRGAGDRVLQVGGGPGGEARRLEDLRAKSVVKALLSGGAVEHSPLSQ